MPKRSPAPPPVPSDAPAKRRGRPPKPEGRKSQVEVQRAYRARLAAAGKVVRIVDANAVRVPGFDPTKDGVYERAMFDEMREKLRNALSNLELREEEVTRLRSLNARLEAERKRLERDVINLTKDKIVLADQLAQKPAKPSAGTSRRSRRMPATR